MYYTINFCIGRLSLDKKKKKKKKNERFGELRLVLKKNRKKPFHGVERSCSSLPVIKIGDSPDI